MMISLRTAMATACVRPAREGLCSAPVCQGNRGEFNDGPCELRPPNRKQEGAKRKTIPQFGPPYSPSATSARDAP